MVFLYNPIIYGYAGYAMLTGLKAMGIAALLRIARVSVGFWLDFLFWPRKNWGESKKKKKKKWKGGTEGKGGKK